MTDVILFLGAIPVFGLGGLIIGPLAYRRGRSSAWRDRREIARLSPHATTITTPPLVVPGRHRMTWAQSRADYRARVWAWWESTNPRDPGELFADEVVVGRPPLRLVRSAA